MNSKQKAILSTIDHLYSATTNSKIWPQALESIAEMVGSRTTVLSMHNIARQATEFNLAVGADPAGVDSYEQHFHRLNPWMNASQSSVSGVVPGEAYVSYESLRRTEFFNDFGRKHGIVHTAAAVLDVEGSHVAYLSINRGQEMNKFSTAEMQIVEGLLPHLKRALQISRHLDFAEDVKRSWDSLSAGMILIQDGRVHGFNSAAGRIFESRDGIKLESERLIFSSKAVPIQFEKLEQQSSSYQGSKPIVVERPSGKRPFVIIVSPPRIAKQFLRPKGASLLIINDPELTTYPTSSDLALAFGLSPAEARLTATLLTAHGLTDAAKQLSISRHTAKAQLNSIFQKTNTRSQVELQSLVFRSFGNFAYSK